MNESNSLLLMKDQCVQTAVTCGYAAASPASPHQCSVISCRLQDPPHILKRRRQFALRGTRRERNVSVELLQLQSDPTCQTHTEEEREVRTNRERCLSLTTAEDPPGTSHKVR